MLIELAYRNDCACGEHAEAIVREGLAKLDIREPVFRRTRVPPGEAARVGMTGCPTIRVNGLDVQGRYRWDRDHRATCRFEEGAPLATVADVIQTIKKTTCPRVGCC